MPTDRPLSGDFDPASLRSKRLRRFFEYWNAKRGTREMPARGNIDPVEIPWLLGYVTLHEVLPEGGFRFRIDATHTANMFGFDMTGRTLAEYPDAQVREMIRSSLVAVLETRQPQRKDLDYGTSFRQWRYERLILPLSEDGARIDMLMSAIDVAPTGES
ncbi:MAG: PAS domain-containing protein [Proteobacteria bacterium]|nr:PAS domain-containing protein [Pseudomonadota bacterium]